MIKTIAIAIVLLIAGMLIFAATRPDTFRVQRSTSIKAPPAKIFSYINEFDRWAAWSPYEKLDPAMKRTRSGPAAGQGAIYEWEGNDKVGKGRMEIAEASPPSKVAIKFRRGLHDDLCGSAGERRGVLPQEIEARLCRAARDARNVAG